MSESNLSFEHVALVVALRDMFNRKAHFSICALDNALKLAGIKISEEVRAPFHALHCVDYADMPPGFKEQLAERTLALFGLPADYKLEITPSQISAPKARWWNLLKAPSVQERNEVL